MPGTKPGKGREKMKKDYSKNKILVDNDLMVEIPLDDPSGIRIISSQQYIADGIVAEKKSEFLAAGPEYIAVPCLYIGEYDGEYFAVMVDKHHSYKAAVELGIKIIFFIGGATKDNRKEFDALLEENYIDSDWYDVISGDYVF